MVHGKGELFGELRGDFNAWSRHELCKTWMSYGNTIILLSFMMVMNDWVINRKLVHSLQWVYLLTYLITYSIEQSPSWEANRFAVSQEIPEILWNPKVHCRSHKCPQSRSESSVHVSWQSQFLRWGVNTSSNPPAGGTPLVGCPRLSIQYICSYPPYWRPFLHPKLEEAPLRGDRDPLVTSSSNILSGIYCILGCHLDLKVKLT
jgi:hypothetical protein